MTSRRVCPVFNLLHTVLLGIGLLASSALGAPAGKQTQIATRVRTEAVRAVVGSPAEISAKLMETRGGAPIAGQEVIFYRGKGKNSAELGRSSTNERGRATISVVYDGYWPTRHFRAVFAGSKRYLPSSATGKVTLISKPPIVDPPGGGGGDPCPSSSDKGRVEGHVTIDGAPAAYAELRFGSGDCGGWAQAGARGHFVFKSTYAGRKTLEVRRTSKATWEPVGPVQIVKGQTVTLEVAYRTFGSGWVVNQ